MIFTCDFWQRKEVGLALAYRGKCRMHSQQPVIQNIGEGGQKWDLKLLTSVCPYYLGGTAILCPKLFSLLMYIPLVRNKIWERKNMNDLL